MKTYYVFGKSKDEKIKESAIRQAMIKYYNTINQGKLALPSFILASIAMIRVKAYERIDELYSKLVY